MDDSKLTILTTTYNRAYLLDNLYLSICRQTDPHVKWLIIDDGSSDNTRNLVDGYSADQKIELRYYYQQNGGKMRAHNFGVAMIETEYFLCVDSDDYLTPDAVELFFANKKYLDNHNVWGMVAYRGVLKSGNLQFMHNSIFPEKQCYSKLNRLYQLGFVSDTALIISTSIMQMNPFILYDNEKFIPESIVYDHLDAEKNIYVLDDILIVCNTQEDGYTNNGIANMVDSPCNSAVFYYSKYKAAVTVWERLKNAGNVFCYELFAHKHICKIRICHWWFAIPGGVFIFLIRLLRYKKILK